MAYKTGDTIYQNIISVNSSNVVESGATFDNQLYRNGILYTGATLNFSLADAPRGMYVASFSASTTGEYQVYSENTTTNTIYISNILSVKSAEDISTSIYIGF
jgi:hypothetical protein